MSVDYIFEKRIFDYNFIRMSSPQQQLVKTKVTSKRDWSPVLTISSTVSVSGYEFHPNCYDRNRHLLPQNTKMHAS
jgi:hypothetical protein